MCASRPKYSRGASGHGLGRWLSRLLTVIGLTTVLVISTPIVSWWVRAYSGPIEQPKGDVLILLSAAADDNNVRARAW